MKILFVIDRIELKYFEFNNLVTNFWLIKEFLSRGFDVFISTIDMLSLKSGVPYSATYRSFLRDENIFYDYKSLKSFMVNDFDLVLFRPDPPVDLDYINATYVLDFVNRSKTVILNETKSIRDFNEKLHAVHFNEYMSENIVTANKIDILQFLETHNEIILKPLNKCFGSGVMYLKYGDKNTSVIINNATNNGTNLVMVQKYLKNAEFGDKRVLILGNQVFDYCVRKLPCENDFKFSIHNDNYIVKDTLSSSEKLKFLSIAKSLNDKGIFMAGLDVIDEKILEINVTSPCYFIKEINNAFKINFEKIIVDGIIEIYNSKRHQTLENTSISTSS